MISIKKWGQALGFTSTEQKVVVFLIAAFLLGAGVKLVQHYIIPVQQFDYSASDEEFSQHFKNSLTADTSEQSQAGYRADSTASLSKQKVSKKELRPKSININTATKSELMTLPGVGETTAERIVVYRKEKGQFTSVEQLMEVKGIGKKKLERLAPFCTTGK